MRKLDVMARFCFVVAVALSGLTAIEVGVQNAMASDGTSSAIPGGDCRFWSTGACTANTCTTAATDCIDINQCKCKK